MFEVQDTFYFVFLLSLDKDFYFLLKMFFWIEGALVTLFCYLRSCHKFTGNISDCWNIIAIIYPLIWIVVLWINVLTAFWTN